MGHLKACNDNGNSGNGVIHALDAVNGDWIWDFRPDNPVWNFYSHYLGDGTFVYQDLEGRVYRNNLTDGSLVWKNGGWPGSWNDGSVGVGPSGIVYGVTNHGPNNCPGDVTAYSISDGKVLWKVDTPWSTNSFPSVGPAIDGMGLMLVVNNDLGQLRGYDAETGKFKWQWMQPKPHEMFKGDKEGLATRLVTQPARPEYVP